MNELLQEITDKYLDDQLENSTLLGVLNQLDDVQLQVVLEHIQEVEEKYGTCKLIRVKKNPSTLSIKTDHPDDPGITYDKSIYRKY